MVAGRRQQRHGAHDRDQLPSLLWPEGHAGKPQGAVGLNPQAASDLDVQPLVQALSDRQADRARFVTDVLADLPTDPAVITYRADALSNLLDD